MVYVVTMYRWGNREKHSYLHGVYDDKELAIKEAGEEQSSRGGNKYFPEILAITLNKADNWQAIKKLPAEGVCGGRNGI